MIVLKILICILVLFVLLLSLRVGVDAGYDQNGLRVYARVSRFTLCLYPTNKEPKPKKQKAKTKTQTRNKPNFTKDELVDAFGVAVRSVKKLRFRLRKLKLHFVSAFDDPYKTAVVYGYAEALIHGLGLPSMKQTDIRLDMDYEKEACEVDGYVSVTIRVYYMIKLLVCLLWGLIPIWRRRRQRIKLTANNTTVKGTTV